MITLLLESKSTTEIQQQEMAEDPNKQNSTIQKLKNDLRILIDKVNEICSVNSSMLQKISELVTKNNELDDRVEKQKVELTELNRYGRRENVEFCNVPESIDDKSLENHIITVMKSIKVNVQSYQIVGVHRIGKKRPNRPRNVIVRFVNRKNAFTLLKNKKSLKNGQYKKYYVIENLCPYNKKIFNTLYKCKKQDEIHSVWTYNGQVFAKIDEHDQPTRISHMDDIDDLFADSEYEDEVEDEIGDKSRVTASGGGQESGGFGGRDGGFGGGFGSTPMMSAKKMSRRLSDIVEESGIRTPIAPLVIKV